MFLLQRDSNRISAIDSSKFSDLAFTERNNLQEWIANTPKALGEDLLIIQKEFNGFDGTQERLDLLALDKDGNLVIVENKLDDSGRDVVWQAIKYASYCSTFTLIQVIEIYQEYLNKENYGAGAKEASNELLEFFEVSELDEISINNSQRVILVAANFRKEVTSTAVWLFGQGINIKCIKVTPYSFNEEIFINFEQIFPTPETADLMITGTSKQSDAQQTAQIQKTRHVLRKEYWERVLEAFHGSSCKLFNNISPTKDHWISAGSGVANCVYQLVFGKDVIRVVLYFDKVKQSDNKFIFDKLIENKSAIEDIFSSELEWERLDDKKSSRIQLSLAVNGYDKEQWSQYIEWQITHMTKLENATKKKLQEAGQSLKLLS